MTTNASVEELTRADDLTMLLLRHRLLTWDLCMCLLHRLLALEQLGLDLLGQQREPPLQFLGLLVDAFDRLHDVVVLDWLDHLSVQEDWLSWWEQALLLLARLLGRLPLALGGGCLCHIDAALFVLKHSGLELLLKLCRIQVVAAGLAV